MKKLFYEDPYAREFEASVVESDGCNCVLSSTAFYPGGGGQPSDIGNMSIGDRTIDVLETHEDDENRIWHNCSKGIPVGAHVVGRIDWNRRYSLMRYHTLLHIVNAVCLNVFKGLITGVQIGTESSRIDFALDGFQKNDILALETQVNEVISSNFEVKSRFISEAEYQSRPELIRTLKVQPPTSNDGVRIVEIEGFDAQACGGTHVKNTKELGLCGIVKYENKGKLNKRFYFELHNKSEGML